MHSTAPDVAKRFADQGRIVVSGEGALRQALLPEELPRRGSGPRGKKFSLRVEPALVEALDKQGARRNRRNQQVLVELHRLLVVDVLGIRPAVPVREALHLGGDVLAIVAFRQRTAAAARLVGDAHDEPIVSRRGEQRRLRKPRRSRDDTALRVYLRDAPGEVEPAG